MPRGSRFSTVLNWFRTADADEVRAIMPLVIEACGQRKVLIDGTKPATTKRHRRTKAELAAAQTSRLNGPEQAAAVASV